MNGHCSSCDVEADCVYPYKPCECCDYRKFKHYSESPLYQRGVASCDAEIATLREQVKMLRDLIFRTATSCRLWGGEAERARKQLEEILAATESKIGGA